MKYTPGFEQAWSAYQGQATVKEKARSGKAESYRRWKRLGLDEAVQSVLGWIATVRDAYSPGYLPGFEVWLKKHGESLAEPLPTPSKPSAAPERTIISPTVRAAINEIGQENAARRASQARNRARIEELAKKLMRKHPGMGYVAAFRQAEREVM